MQSTRLALLLSLLLAAGGGLACAASKPLIVAHPTRQAQVLYDYLCTLPGKGVLSGQMLGQPGLKGERTELVSLASLTGKAPAIIGLDVGEPVGLVETAVDHWKKGGVVCVTWSWAVPAASGPGGTATGEIDLALAVTPGTAPNRALLADIDRMAKVLVQLREAGVPVLWRPLHQANSGRQWWGRGGPDVFKELWQLMFERLAHRHQLDNLIWVLAYSGRPDHDWYPGDEYVDIAGVTDPGGLGHGRAHRHVLSIVGFDRPASLAEVAVPPDLAASTEEKAHWIWFLAAAESLSAPENAPGWVKAYAEPAVITLDEVPALGRTVISK